VRRWFEILLRWSVGGLFVTAGALKMAAPAGFADDVARYGLLPDALVNMVALTLPAVEVVAGVFLALGMWKRASAAVIAVMCVLFLVAVIVGLARGLEVCGCFGASVARKASPWTLAEDIVLLVAAVWLWQKSEKQ
jgi:uncharacterized membrane protein YphA (DoxX/SURF4 family)